MNISQELAQLRVHLEGLKMETPEDSHYHTQTRLDVLHQNAIIEDCLRMVNTWL